jgi:DNA polymerase I-like protein with 3'-5' exonuclease and polymerase domains
MDPHALVQSWIAVYRPDVNRTQAKQGSFSKLYGSGIETFARTINVPRDVAIALRDAYDAAMPEAKALFDRAMYAASTRGWVRTRTGRRTRFPVNGEGRRMRTHKGLNAIIQGFAADINKMALRSAYEARKTLGITMHMTVHDSMENSGPREAAKPFAAFMNALKFPTRVPIMWDTSAGPSWGETEAL